MANFTVKNLRADVDTINDWLRAGGYPYRLETGGSYGRQSVDEYSVDTEGNRIGTGVNYRVVSGSSRECSHAAYAYYGEVVTIGGGSHLLRGPERGRRAGRLT